MAGAEVVEGAEPCGKIGLHARPHGGIEHVGVARLEEILALWKPELP
jgi:hypothetical protein